MEFWLLRCSSILAQNSCQWHDVCPWPEPTRKKDQIRQWISSEYFWAYTHDYIPNGPAGRFKVPFPTQEGVLMKTPTKIVLSHLFPTIPVFLCVNCSESLDRISCKCAARMPRSVPSLTNSSMREAPKNWGDLRLGITTPLSRSRYPLKDCQYKPLAYQIFRLVFHLSSFTCHFESSVLANEGWIRI